MIADSTIQAHTGLNHRIFSSLETLFRVLGERLKMQEKDFPPVISVEDLNALNYFKDHPRQGVFLSTLPNGIPAERQAIDYALNPAACYHAYLSQRNRQLDEMARIFTSTQCYRNSEKDSEPILTFCQWKYVFMGESRPVQAAVKTIINEVKNIAQALDLPVNIQPSIARTEPALNRNDQIRQLFMADQEFLYEGFPAIGHVNFHRNYFSKRLNIQTPDQRPAFAACLGLIPDYWLASLLDRNKESPELILNRIHQYLTNNP